MHTTQGELLRCLELPHSNKTRSVAKCPRILLMSRECFILSVFEKGHMALYTASGRLIRHKETDKDIEVHSMSILLQFYLL